MLFYLNAFVLKHSISDDNYSLLISTLRTKLLILSRKQNKIIRWMLNEYLKISNPINTNISVINGPYPHKHTYFQVREPFSIYLCDYFSLFAISIDYSDSYYGYYLASRYYHPVARSKGTTVWYGTVYDAIEMSSIMVPFRAWIRWMTISHHVGIFYH